MGLCRGQGGLRATGAPIHAMTPLVKLLGWPAIARNCAAGRALRLAEGVGLGGAGSASGRWTPRSPARPGSITCARGRGMRGRSLSPGSARTGSRRSCRPPRARGRARATTARRRHRAETAFNVGASDGALANLGDGALSPPQMALTIGTSLAVRTGSPTPFTDAATRCFCYVLGPDIFVVGGRATAAASCSTGSSTTC